MGETPLQGLKDSHTLRGGLNYNLELRWDGVPSLADGLRMLWVRVVGGWSEFQFAEQRMPTLDELNQAAPDRPCSYFTCMIGLFWIAPHCELPTLRRGPLADQPTYAPSGRLRNFLRRAVSERSVTRQ